MDKLDFLISAIALAISTFAAGYNLAIYFTSEYHIRMKVQDRLTREMDKRCASCQKKKDLTSAATKPQAMRPRRKGWESLME